MINEDQDKIDFSEYENVGDELLADAGGAVGKELPDDMHPLARKAIYAIDNFSNWQGRIACLLVVPIIFGMFYEVVARSFFTSPTLWAYDLSRILYGVSFMLGAAYALMRGLHIRADFLYRGFSERTQGRVDLILYIVLFMPSMLFFLKAGYDFSLKSFIQGERAGDSTWAPIVWPVKIALTTGVFFLCIQGISEILKSWYAATRGKWPV
ncbi:TRAP-type mannitol/chloroaromatic compound transport system permease small subunit [Litoreibacter meonggei]|uniref:TRAP transporter small permease protein n=1 Tax=Litoreibacter meonggei TaxID=1049199 RepID=A0A497X4F7_9RHOB|nr:TRAP transporter small permease subunit [Litoreibacter meonggei]RLJ60096.1 TRAP-type mannitol/chloroaromatic compound transport system permease small subunit [Litoreibacter meonggei]